MKQRLMQEDVTHVNRPVTSGWSKRFAVLAVLLCVAAACASAGSVSLTLTGVNLASYSCFPDIGVAGGVTLTIDASGGIQMEFPHGPGNAGCYVGNTAQTGDTTFIGGLTGGLMNEGTAAQLNALTFGWYAEFGTMCDQTGACTASSNSTNGNNSADIEILVNPYAISEQFQIVDTSSNIDSAANNQTANCSYTTSGTTGHPATFTVAAGTICVEDLSTGASIAFDASIPETTPEVTTLLLVGTGLFLMGCIRRRKNGALLVSMPFFGR